MRLDWSLIPFLEKAASCSRLRIFPTTPSQRLRIVVLAAGFLKQAAEVCHTHRVLLTTDEIHSGLGRTGKLFAYMHEGIRPDMLIVGKALAGGFYPVSAVLSSNQILGVYNPGDHGSTLGGNPPGLRSGTHSLARPGRGASGGTLG